MNGACDIGVYCVTVYNKMAFIFLVISDMSILFFVLMSDEPRCSSYTHNCYLRDFIDLQYNMYFMLASELCQNVSLNSEMVSHCAVKGQKMATYSY